MAFKRELNLVDGIFMGLASILGTGIFVSIGFAVELVGPLTVVALAMAGGLALCNALSLAQLSRAFPHSGGTYEFANQTLNPLAGFAAGWLFVVAKSASAATCVLGIAAYLLPSDWRFLGAAAVLSLMLVLGLMGVKKSRWFNYLIVVLTSSGLIAYCVLALSHFDGEFFYPFFQNRTGSPSPVISLLEATALMFVAFTGYGRVATLGEEIKNPEKNIPIAILLSLLVAFVLYVFVCFASLGAVGSQEFSILALETSAPLEHVLRALEHPTMAFLLSLCAVLALLGVLFNLVLGISRVLVAMSRRGELPSKLCLIQSKSGVPAHAIGATLLFITFLVCWGDLRLTWSVSAFCILIYYAITNLASLKLHPRQMEFPIWTGAMGLIGCVVFLIGLELRALLLGAALTLTGFVVRVVIKYLIRIVK